jgi:hypothetical protein
MDDAKSVVGRAALGRPYEAAQVSRMLGREDCSFVALRATIPRCGRPARASGSAAEADGARKARTDTKIARFEGKLDVVISKLDDIRENNKTVREGQRALS